jgi:hypothetical protein
MPLASFPVKLCAANDQKQKRSVVAKKTSKPPNTNN